MAEPLKITKNKFKPIAVGAIVLCVILAISVVGIYFLYNTAQSAYNSELQTYANYQSNSQSQVSSLQSQVSQLNSQISSLQSELSQAQSSGSTSNAITNLQDSTVWVNDQTYTQPSSSYSTVTFSASYAGYVSVYIQSSSVSGTWVEVIYSSHGVNYDVAYTGSQAISAGNTVEFPILPSSSITIGIGNGNLLSSATEVATITYYY